jgi:hypothetical protein
MTDGDEMDGGLETSVGPGELEPSASAATAADAAAETVAYDPAFAARRQRIYEHRAKALDHADAAVACVSGVTSDLADIQLIIAERLRQDLTAEGGSLEVIERHQNLIDLHLRYAKQIGQLAQFERRLRRDADGDVPPPRPR